MRAKFGVEPALIPDYLALVGDAADGFPGITGIRPKSAASLLARYGGSRNFRPRFWASDTSSRSFSRIWRRSGPTRSFLREWTNVQWQGPTEKFAAFAERLGDSRLLERALKAPVVVA